MATPPPGALISDEQEVEYVDDPDLEAALDEAEVEEGEPADEVFAAIDTMLEAIGRAVA
jgi:hypothetical protein